MDRARIAYYLRAIAAELEKEGDRVVVRAADIFAGIPAEEETEKTPAVAISAPAGAIIHRHWSNRRHVAYTPEETAFISKCRETGDDAQTIADKVERRFGFRVSDRAIRHRIAKLEGKEDN